MTKLLDYSSGWPSGATVKADGYAGVLRYAVPGNSKSITPAEASSMAAAGRTVTLVYESTSGRMLAGFAAGAQDAANALAHGRTLGFEPRVIYFACDFDAQVGQLETVVAYLNGAASKLGRSRVGLYGGETVIRYAMTVAAADWFWQTAAWGSTKVPGIHLYQNIGYVTVGGVTCDENDALADDYGQHPAPTGQKPATPPTPEEDDMTPEQFATLQQANNRLGLILHALALDAKPTPTDKLHLPTPPYSLWARLGTLTKLVQALAAHMGVDPAKLLDDLDAQAQAAIADPGSDGAVQNDANAPGPEDPALPNLFPPSGGRG